MPEPALRTFFWSARTLRCSHWDENAHLLRVEDILSVDQFRCVFAHPPYDDLIVRLLNEHFSALDQPAQSAADSSA